MGRVARFGWIVGVLAIAGATWGAGIACAAGEDRAPDLAANARVIRALAHIRGRAVELGLRPGTEFTPLRARERDSRHYVRLGQTHRGIPVFGAQAVVQLDGASQVVFELPDVASSPALDGVGVTPHRTSAEAVTTALDWVQSKHPEVSLESRAPTLQIFAPEVLGLSGDARLVWVIEAGPAQGGHRETAHRLLIDATDGTVVRAYPMVLHAQNRLIYDCQNSFTLGPLVRSEGSSRSTDADANAAYTHFGFAYSFYATKFGRDGIDNLGMSTVGGVHYCANSIFCPYQNAFWSTWDQAIFFGEGYPTDDVAAHEYTHGVTEHESGLIYENASGALNESMSDIFGEFIDMTNDPNSEARWLIGEGLPLATLRDMEDPPAFNQPDRVGSPLYFPPVPNPGDPNDQGGVHTNSGVSNKLCFLLTDGGTFQGQTVDAMGMDRVARLFYEANANLLVPATEWSDLYLALRQAAINLGWNVFDRGNLDRACIAVQIACRYVRANSCTQPDGDPLCSPNGAPYPTVTAGVAAMIPGWTLLIRGGDYPETPLLNKIGRLECYEGTVRIGN